MKKIKFTTALLALATIFTITTSCDDNETYADRREREKKQINSFLETGAKVESDDKGEYILNIPGNIKVISEAEFYKNDSTTDVSKNEYVRFNGSGIFMQIVRKGEGKKIQEGESVRILNRFVEFNIAADSITASNTSTLLPNPQPDIMTCQNNFGTLTASFVSGIMQKMYSTKAVPSGWLVPLHYINLSPWDSDKKALVRLILPSTEGQNDAQYNVYPCFYEISYQRN